MIPGRTMVVPNGSASEAKANICSPSSVFRSAHPLPRPLNVNQLQQIDVGVGPGEIKVRGRAVN